MKKWIALLLALIMTLSLFGCGGNVDPETEAILEGLGEAVLSEALEALTEGSQEEASPEAYEPEAEEEGRPAEDGWYYSAGDVALYLHTYGCLPDNFITKSEARDLGWEGGSVEDYAPGKAIGGDVFGNREGLLPEADGRVYYECDIDTDGRSSRGAKRLVFSNDGLIYYTEDHYESFTLLYGEE